MAYGKELILDLYGCDVTKFEVESIERYLVQLCDLIDMERCQLEWWNSEPGDDSWGVPHLQGNSCVQFIKTSAVVIHALVLTGECYIDIFTCKELSVVDAVDFTVSWFGAKKHGYQVIERGGWSAK